MYPPGSRNKHQSWTRNDFLISTDPALIDLPTLNDAFDSDFLYWAKRLPEDALQDMLDMSLNFGLYATTNAISTAQADPSKTANTKPPLIGFARLITDNVTFAYLTDVYILSEYRNQGLGEWLVRTVQEVLNEMPWLRRSMAILGDQRLAQWYEKHMGMNITGGEGSGVWVISRRGEGTAFG